MSSGATPPGPMPVLPVIAPVAVDGDPAAAADAWTVGPVAGLDPLPLQSASRGLEPTVPDGEAEAVAPIPLCVRDGVPQPTRSRPARTITTADLMMWNRSSLSPTRTGTWANRYSDQ